MTPAQVIGMPNAPTANPTPIGAIVQGNFSNNPSYLPCDGLDYPASYPGLDLTGLATLGANAWTARTLPVTQLWTAVAFGNSMFVAVGLGFSSGYVATSTGASSPDGATWTGRTLPSGIWNGVIYAGGQFVAFGQTNGSGNVGVCATSPDGITWTQRTVPNLGITGMTYANGLYVAFGFAGSGLATVNYITSSDGITWTTRSMPSSVSWRYATVLNNVFYASSVDIDGAGGAGSFLAISSDGINWTSRQTPLSFGAYGLWAFNGRLITTNLSSIFQSTNQGFSWDTGTNLLNGYSCAEALGANTVTFGFAILNGLMLASGPSYTLPRVMKSIDGYSSVPLLMPSNTYWGAFAYGNGTIVCIGGGYSSVTTNAAASIPFDTTKFRTPRMVRVNDTDRYYIKVK